MQEPKFDNKFMSSTFLLIRASQKLNRRVNGDIFTRIPTLDIKAFRRRSKRIKNVKTSILPTKLWIKVF